jgi:hypothetical protein
MMHITRSNCRKFIETMSNVFICSLIVSMNLLHIERVICIISYSCLLYEPPTHRTDEFVTHSLYELPAVRTGDMHLETMSNVFICSRCMRFIETMSNVFTCSRCRRFIETT